MRKGISIERKARRVMLDMMSNIQEANTQDIMELIKPHVQYDIQELQRQALQRLAGNLIRQKRDESGVRDFYNCKDEGGSKYVNVTKTTSKPDLDKINANINRQYIGLTKSKKKIEHRQMELMGQIALEELLQR